MCLIWMLESGAKSTNTSGGWWLKTTMIIRPSVPNFGRHALLGLGLDKSFGTRIRLRLSLRSFTRLLYGPFSCMAVRRGLSLEPPWRGSRGSTSELHIEWWRCTSRGRVRGMSGYTQGWRMSWRNAGWRPWWSTSKSASRQSRCTLQSDQFYRNADRASNRGGQFRTVGGGNSLWIWTSQMRRNLPLDAWGRSLLDGC